MSTQRKSTLPQGRFPSGDTTTPSSIATSDGQDEPTQNSELRLPQPGQPHDTRATATVAESPAEPAEADDPYPEACLTEEHRDVLSRSAISYDVMRARGYQSTAATREFKRSLADLNIHVTEARAKGILIPVRDIWGQVVYHQFRPDNPDKDAKGKERKYVDPTGANKVLDIPAGLREQLADPSIPLWITEGAKKVDAGVSAGRCVIGVLGVHCFDSPGISWAGIALHSRLVYICYDSDAAQNRQVQTAERKLAQFLQARGAEVKVLRIFPFPDGEKCGLDDYLASDYEVEELLKRAQRPDGETGTEVEYIQFSDVLVRETAWIWRDYIPLGTLSEMLGNPGLGKSTILSDIAARVTKGELMPDGSRSSLTEPAGVVILAAEDDPSRTILPRLAAAGADLNRVGYLRFYRSDLGDVVFTIPDDLARIREKILDLGARLIIIDPILSALNSKTDSHKDQDVRRALAPVISLAAEADAAIVALRHLNKNVNLESAIYRGGGSIAFSAIARSVLLVEQDSHDEDVPEIDPVTEKRVPKGILASVKNSLGAQPESRRFALTGKQFELQGMSVSPAIIRWGDAAAVTADELVRNGGSRRPQDATTSLREFLTPLLADGPIRAKELKQACGDAGVSWATLRDHRYKERLGLRSFHRVEDDGTRAWWWDYVTRIRIVTRAGGDSEEDANHTE